MYCGNNANHPGLLNGTQVLGTRYNCLLKGKQFGYYLPADPSFTQPYSPIDPTRKYCGNSPNVPNGYNRFGGLYECYLTGVGVGKKQKAQEVLGNKKSSKKSVRKSAKKSVRKSAKKSVKKSRKSVKKSRKSVRKSRKSAKK